MISKPFVKKILKIRDRNNYQKGCKQRVSEQLVTEHYVIDIEGQDHMLNRPTFLAGYTAGPLFTFKQITFNTFEKHL